MHFRTANAEERLHLQQTMRTDESTALAALAALAALSFTMARGRFGSGQVSTVAVPQPSFLPLIYPHALVVVRGLHLQGATLMACCCPTSVTIFTLITNV